MKAFLQTIPAHLKQYITEQHPELYTPIDQALWRYVMRVSKKFFSKHAHPLYLNGIDATGMSVDHIPLIEEMDTALKKLGWRAVAINGFIPPSVFLEFQALKILAIACDIRKLENLGYTPSPDIIHEAAGHAPIVADPAYRKYLESYGEVARNAIISKGDLDLYEAIFNLSEIKENPASTSAQIAEAQKKFEEVSMQVGEPSEAALLTRMAWWTTEYGLVGSAENPLIYGAGLLSSVSESYHCLSSDVKKIPFSLEAVIQTSYDITRPQPQLFVAKNFEQLEEALQEFASTMAFKRGGEYGLSVAKQAQNTVTILLGHRQFQGGVQLTGVVEEFSSSHFVISGKKQISYQDKMIPEYHSVKWADSFYIPLLENSEPPASKKLEDVQALNGAKLLGQVIKTLELAAGVGLWFVESLKVIDAQGKQIFEAKGSISPLVFGASVKSVFGGAADRAEFALRDQSEPKVKIHKTNQTQENEKLCALYAQVHEMRKNNTTDFARVQNVLDELNLRHPNDWLLRLELLELVSAHEELSRKYSMPLKSALEEISKKNTTWNEMIKRGLELIGE